MQKISFPSAFSKCYHLNHHHGDDSKIIVFIKITKINPAAC